MLWALSLVLTLVPIAEPIGEGTSEYTSSALVASNGESFAVAWNGEIPHVVIYDGRGNVLARTTRFADEPAFVQDLTAIGNDYVLAYVTSNLLHIAVIREDGRVVTNHPVMPGWSAAIATLGTTMLMMNERGAGTLLDGAGAMPVTISETTTYSPDVAASRSKFFAVWLDEGQLRGSLFVPGATRASAFVVIGAADPAGFAEDRPSIASDGEAFVVAWKAGSEMHVADIDRNGAPSQPRIIARDATGVPSLTWTGAGYLLVYPSEHDFVTIALGSGLTTRTSSGGKADHPRIASSRTASLIVRKTYGACFSNEGNSASFVGAANSFLLTTGAGAQRDPAAAADAVVFIERGEDWRLRVASRPFGGPVSTIRSSGELAAPAIAEGAGVVLVAWLERQADCSLNVKVAAGEQVHTLATNVAGVRPAIGWNGSEFVVVWQHGGFAELDGARVARDGTPIERTPVQLTNPVKAPDSFTGVGALSPSLRWNGSEWLLVWQFLQITEIPFHSDPPPISLVRSRRIARDLRPVSVEQTIAENAWFPTIAARGPVAVWSEPRGIVTAHIADDGTMTQSLISSARPGTLSLACSQDECAVAADDQLLRLSRDGAFVVASQTLDGPIAALTNDGRSFLAIIVRDQRLFATEVPPLGPRRRIVGR